MLYSFLRGLARLVVRLINGSIDVRNRHFIPKQNYILIAPHRTWLDVVMLALAASPKSNPKEFGFLAKKELFQNKIARYVLDKAHGIPVDRKNPGPSVVIKPAQLLKNSNLSFMIFPSGSRHSSKAKSGAALIAQLSKAPLLPAVYQGPLTIKGLLRSHKTTYVAFGKPIYIPKTFNLRSKKDQHEIDLKMQDSFKTLDHSINPNYHYSDSYLKNK